MQCEACLTWFHLAPCCNVDSTKYDALNQNGLIGIVRWFCKRCNKRVMQNNNSDIEDIKKRLDVLEDIKNIEQIVERKMKQLAEETTELEKRKHNVIVHGIPEAPEEIEEDNGEVRVSTPTERKQHDLQKLSQLKQDDNQLELKDNDIESVFRIGAKRENMPRMLCVRLRSPEVRSRLLENSPSLRKSKLAWKKKVYINPDLTKEQRERNQHARNELKRRKENGETDLIIRNFEVVKRPTRRDAA